MIQKFFVTLVCAFLTLPLINEFISIEPQIVLTENRQTADVPKFNGSYTQYIREIESYYNDHFGFRNFLVFSANLITLKVFNESSTDKVIIGKSGWIFFAGEQEEFHKKEKIINIENILQGLLHWKNKFENLNIPFIFFIAPDKQTVYPEYLKYPQAEWKQVKSLEIYNTQIQKELGSTFINTLPLLNDAKGKGKKLYFKADSHWNDIAAFEVYERVMDALLLDKNLANIQKLKLQDCKVERRLYTGDLVRIFWGIGRLYDEFEFFIDVPSKDFIKVTPFIDHYKDVPITKEFYVAENHSKLNTRNQKTLLAVRDSQFIPMIPLFAESFSKVILINVWEDNASIERIIALEKPDAVLFESVERGLIPFLKKL
ncbi:hypothetical protein LPTSP4_02940 [Leptospira ryugenii]|uniref:AlgX/AlgJ SGNH hydrolase-like domain-containing protein n=1 Tax=Leptospira ryugenii TaxID=1917863 RepID=A0A2P2DVY5_9LEPT|nr:hypothetical protein [Leptospira ryugenii]GBF48794.1 hypothetical protein LPTSP4_02940 [Leptospira ryugenii]